jgi:hypothetical protein
MSGVVQRPVEVTSTSSTVTVGYCSSSVPTLWCASPGAPAFHRGATSCSAWTDLIASVLRKRREQLDAYVSPGETHVPATAPGRAETEEDPQ